jgi:hypothetical protein
MKTKLCGFIAQIMYEMSDLGVCPDIKRVICTSSGLPFHVIINSDAEKAVLLGLMTDPIGELIVKGYTINFSKWNWASTEGFDLDGIFADNLYKEIFEDIQPHNVSTYLLRDK